MTTRESEWTLQAQLIVAQIAGIICLQCFTCRSSEYSVLAWDSESSPLLLVVAFVQQQTPVRRMSVYWGVAMVTTTPPLWTTCWRRWGSVTPTHHQWWEDYKGKHVGWMTKVPPYSVGGWGLCFQQQAGQFVFSDFWILSKGKVISLVLLLFTYYMSRQLAENCKYRSENENIFHNTFFCLWILF